MAVLQNKILWNKIFVFDPSIEQYASFEMYKTSSSNNSKLEGFIIRVATSDISARMQRESSRQSLLESGKIRHFARETRCTTSYSQKTKDSVWERTLVCNH